MSFYNIQSMTWSKCTPPDAKIWNEKKWATLTVNFKLAISIHCDISMAIDSPVQSVKLTSILQHFISTTSQCLPKRKQTLSIRCIVLISIWGRFGFSFLYNTQIVSWRLDHYIGVAILLLRRKQFGFRLRHSVSEQTASNAKSNSKK